MKSKERALTALKNRMQSMALALALRAITVLWIPEYQDELGYTMAGQKIYVSCDHPLMEGLTRTQKYLFIMGVFAHELMHQLSTDFQACERVCAKLTGIESQIFMSITNVLEDPAIEYHAPAYMGGILLKALSFSIAWIYKHTPDIDGTNSGFSQWMTAAIQYGDGGVLKGEITDPKAKEIFTKSLPIFDKGIIEPDGTKRIKIAEELFEVTRPLWEEEAKKAEARKKLAEELGEIMGNAGKSTKGSGDAPMMPPPLSSGSSSESAEHKNERRKKTRETAEEETGGAGTVGEEGEDSEDDATAGESGASSDGKEADSEEATSSGKSSTGGEDGEDGEEGSEEGTPSKDTGSKKEDGDGKDASSSDEESSSSSKADGASDGKGTVSGMPTGEDSIEDADLLLSEEDIETIKGMLAEDASGKEVEDAKVTGLLESTELNERYACKCINLNVKGSDSMLEREYSQRVSKMSGGIQLLTNNLKRLFKNAREQKEYRRSGRLNIKRLYQPRQTTRVFTRRTVSSMDDVCMELVVDVSGSMRGDRIIHARDTAIALAEVCANLSIPMKVIAFTADNRINGTQYDVIHYHYVNWQNGHSSRVPLVSLEARWNNFDGYSIRYAAQVLKKRKEAHKLMIVISDGRPACYSYASNKAGITDTTNAIKEASKVATVIGVAIGGDKDILFEMYGRRFVNIHKLDELYSQLSVVIKNEIKSWG